MEAADWGEEDGRDYMKIATLNIDWAEKYKSKNHFLEIQNYLNLQDFDFLILTESINLNLNNYDFNYFSELIPKNIIYEKLNYTEYLRGEKAFRIAIYSKIKFKKQFEVVDNKTSLALEFETELGTIIIYATIIGTRYKEKPFAKNELENCIIDCKKIYQTNQNLLIVGDLNTSFNVNEKKFTINPETTESLKQLFENLNLINATQDIEQNIDHIIIPKNFENNLVESKVFVEKNELSDHKGIYITLNNKF